MGVRGSGVWSESKRVVRESWREIHDENITFMAGSIAYHAFVSMLPLLLLAVVALAAFDDEALTASLAETSRPFLTPYARELLVESIDVTATRTSLSVVGMVTLLWGASKIFRGLDVAFSEIYDTHVDKTPLEQFEDAIVVFVALSLAVFAFLVAGAVATLVPSLPYPAVINPLLLVAGFAIAFFPIYYVFPDVDVTPREVLPGVAVAAVGWTTLQALFQGYVTLVARYEAVYGTLGSAFLLLIWLYFSSLILLVGGVVNAVLAGRTGDEHALDVFDRESSETGDDGPLRHRPNAAPERARTDADGRFGSSDRTARESGSPDSSHSTDCASTVERARSPEELVRAYEELDADYQRLREEVQRLNAQNERLRRANDALNRRLARRRRSVVAKAKRWLFEK
ncbi:YihY/virulence factor BrkB family protein [Halorussus salinisoli]|uniref:YihY/virulence factor BrkB family protein n=1 Tax=Halorussus salinisoli TaxID=2558242 RepID=UPI0010C23E5D|nr:YhjD/YihY/BrkB family envelope integrity protein [Halorussus salinisoli]